MGVSEFLTYQLVRVNRLLNAAKEIKGLNHMMPPMNQTKKFVLEGYVKKKTGRLFFRQVLNAPNEKMAIELAYCLIGSRKRAKRTEIELQKIEEVQET